MKKKKAVIKKPKVKAEIEPLFDSDFRVKALCKELVDVVDSHIEKHLFTKATVIGCLEVVKDTVLNDR